MKNFPCEIDIKTLHKKLCIQEDHSYFTEIQQLTAEAQALGRPKIVYKKATIDFKGDNFVVIDGIKLTSRVLRVNLEEASHVFPYIVTCGTELEVWAKQFEDTFISFCADVIVEVVLRAALRKFERHLEKDFELGHTVDMNPGSLADWPINEQRHLFELIGHVQDLIGVQLLDSYLMYPIKTVSGIRFSREGVFENCQLCPRERCPSRKALYDKANENYYMLKKPGQNQC